ncbi:MAG: alpha/beta hydrolase [Dehalococcoidia bacterium]|nr:alpha/beta hydrolase [Dehalococcoidia bacterium]
MPTASINGTEIYYETYGTGFPLVFAHGGFGGLGTGQSSGPPAWVAKFTDDFEVILPDRRSSGRSGFPDTPHTQSLFASDIRELLRHLGHDKAHIFGTSAGGPTVLTFAIEHPDATASLVATDTAPWLSKDPDLLNKLRERIEILKTKGVEAAYEARRQGGTVGLNLFAAARTAQSQEEEDQRAARRAAIQAQLAQVPREERIAKYGSELRTYEAHLNFDCSARLGESKAPALVIYGTGDTVYPNVGWEQLLAGKPNYTYVPIAGAEHGVAGEHPAVYDTIIEFCRKHTPVTA